MERDIELAVRHAADLARARGSPLAAITLRGGGAAHVVKACAEAALQRLGVLCAEIRVELASGPVRLSSIELQTW